MAGADRLSCRGMSAGRFAAVVWVGLAMGAPVAPAQDGSEGLPTLLAEVDVHMRTKSWGAALKVLESALKLEPKDFDVNYKAARCYEALANDRAAVDHYERAQKARPDDVDVAYRLGRMLIATGRAKEALPHLERAYQKDPEVEGLRAALGRLYFETGEIEKALPFLKQAVKADRKDPELRYYYAETLFRDERYEDAKDEFTAAFDLAQGKAEYQNLVGKIQPRQQLCQLRIRTFGVLEENGRRFRNKAFGATVQKPPGSRWGWLFPKPMPDRLVFQAGTDDGAIEVVCEAYSNALSYTIGQRTVKPTEMKPFFEALQKELESKYNDLKKERGFRVLRQAKKQETICYTGQRKFDLKKLDVQLSIGVVGQRLYRLEIVAAQGSFKDRERRAEIEALLNSVAFEDD